MIVAAWYRYVRGQVALAGWDPEAVPLDVLLDVGWASLCNATGRPLDADEKLLGVIEEQTTPRTEDTWGTTRTARQAASAMMALAGGPAPPRRKE